MEHEQVMVNDGERGEEHGGTGIGTGAGGATTTRTTRTVVTSRIVQGGGGSDAAMMLEGGGGGADMMYGGSDSLGDVILSGGGAADIGGGGGVYGSTTLSSSQLDRAQNDLSSYKKRIDANIEQQREHSDMMAALQRKVQEYRRRFADIEGRLATQKSDEDVTFNLKEVREEWAPKLMAKGIDEGDLEWMSRFEDERRRNEEMRLQNEQLQTEIQSLHQQFELILRDKERLYQSRERNLTEYLGDSQRKMMEVYQELQQVRRQCAECKEQTERDLENQRNEFLKVMRGVGGVARQLNLTTATAEGGAGYHPLISDTSSAESGGGTVINQDTVLIEAVKRFRDLQAAPAGAASGGVFLDGRLVGGAEDADLHKELMKKYEESIERIIELESQGDGSAGKVVNLEAELKRTKDRLAESLEALRKLHNLARESIPESDKAAPILPPGSTQVIPSEVVRSVRFVIRSRDNEMQQLQRKLKNSEAQVTELEIQFTSADEARKRFEKQLADAKKDIANQTKALDDANREIKRLEDRLRKTESEKNAVDSVRTHLEDEVKRLKALFDQNATDVEKKALEDAEERIRELEDEYKMRIGDLTRRVDTLQSDNKHLRADYNALKDKHRNMEVEYNTVVRRIDEKDVAIKNLEALKGDLMRDLEKERARYDAVNNELDTLQNNYMTTTKNTLVIESTIKEVKTQRDELAKQRDDLQRELDELRVKLDAESRARQEMDRIVEQQRADLEKLRADIADNESELQMLRRHNDELDTQAKTMPAKLAALENQLSAAQTEIKKLNELNARLQTDKDDVMRQRQKSEAGVDALNERIRKLEQETQKLRAENAALHESEQKANDAYKEMAQKAHLLGKELEDVKAELDELKQRLSRIDDENREKVELTLMTKAAPTGTDEKPATRETTSVYETTQIHEIRIRELGDKYKLDLDKIQNDKDDLESRVRILEDELADKQRTLERQETEFEDLKHNHQLEVDRLKADLASLQTKYQNDLDDERDQNAHNIEVLKATEEDLRNKLAVTERRVQELLDKHMTLEKENADWQDKYNVLLNELHKLRDELDSARNDADKEIQKWKTDCIKAQTDLRSAEATNESLRNQLNAANDRAGTLNRTINEQNAKIRELNAQIRRLEEQLEDAKSTVASHETDLDDTVNRLHALEDQYAALQLENSKLKSDMDSMGRELDTLRATHATDESELERLKKKLQYVTDAAKEQAEELQKIKDERDQLEKAYREKAKQVDQLKELAQTFDVRMSRMRQECQEASEKLLDADRERGMLRNEVKKLQQELQFGREQMIRKTDEYNVALEDLSNAHRVAEDGRVNAVQELETKKYELNDLQARLDNAEQRLGAIQQDYITADNDRTMLADSLRRFQSVVNRTVAISKFQQLAGRGDEVVLEHPEDMIKKETVTHVQAAPGHGINVAEAIDIQGLDSNIQKLIARIDKLERERNEYRESLGRLKRKTSDSHVTINKHETLYKSIEEKFNDAEEDRKTLEMRLASAKQLLRSQEEALKQRDDERRQLKSKIVAFELQARGKDAQIRHLNETIKTLRADVENAQTEARSLRDREEVWDTRKFKLESQMRDHEGESQRVSMLMSSFETERQSLNESVKKLASQLQQSESKNADLRDDVEKMKRDLSKADSVESELRRNLEEKSRIAQEVASLREQLNIAQSDLLMANSRKQQLENELMAAKSDLREQKQHLSEASNRLSDLQRQLTEAQNEKNRLNDRLYTLDKNLTQQRTTESDLRQQLSTVSADKKSMQNELEELRRRVGQFETDKRVARDKLDELARIRVQLIKKIDLLEAEKRKAEAVISETASQREAIERSLSALERENKELYKNSAQLQQQVAQLEMDNGNRLIALTNKQREEHDRFVQTVRNEKAQYERIVENRDRTQKNRIKQLEGQLAMLRDQLNNERRRRRDVTDRMMISDMSKLAPKMFGMQSTVPASAGGAYYTGATQLGSLHGAADTDYAASRGSYSAYGMSPRPEYWSLGTDFYKAPSSSIPFKEPVDMGQDSSYMYRSSFTTATTGYADGGAGSFGGVGGAIRLEPMREIDHDQDQDQEQDQHQQQGDNNIGSLKEHERLEEAEAEHSEQDQQSQTKRQ